MAVSLQQRAADSFQLSNVTVRSHERRNDLKLVWDFILVENVNKKMLSNIDLINAA